MHLVVVLVTCDIIWLLLSGVGVAVGGGYCRGDVIDVDITILCLGVAKKMASKEGACRMDSVSSGANRFPVGCNFDLFGLVDLTYNTTNQLLLLLLRPPGLSVF